MMLPAASRIVVDLTETEVLGRPIAVESPVVFLLSAVCKRRCVLVGVGDCGNALLLNWAALVS